MAFCNTPHHYGGLANMVATVGRPTQSNTQFFMLDSMVVSSPDPVTFHAMQDIYRNALKGKTNSPSVLSDIQTVEAREPCTAS